MAKLKYFYIILIIVIIIALIAILNKQTPSGDEALVTETVDSSSISAQTNNSAQATAYSNNNLSSKDKFTVVVDAGHGSVDSGSVGPRGTLEKDLTLSITLKLGKILEAQGINVVYTRKTDKFPWAGQKEDLISRAELANNSSADLFISIHMNSSDYKEARGTETYYHPSSTKGKNLANLIQNQIVKEVKLRDRGIKSEDYSVLRNVSAPSVIIELGYLSNYTEEAILRDTFYHDKFAKAIAEGVSKYFQ